MSMDPVLAKAELDIQERASIVPEELVDLITGGTVDATVSELVVEYGLTELQKKLLENEICLVLLLFLSPDSFGERLEESLEVGYEASQTIARRVNEEIFYLVDDILDSVEQARKELGESKGIASLPQKMERREDLTKLADMLSLPRTQQEPAVPTTADSSGVEPIRTMEADMNRVHGYGAYVAQRDGEVQEQAEPVAEIDADIPRRDEVERG